MDSKLVEVSDILILPSFSNTRLKFLTTNLFGLQNIISVCSLKSIETKCKKKNQNNYQQQ